MTIPLLILTPPLPLDPNPVHLVDPAFPGEEGVQGHSGMASVTPSPRSSEPVERP